MLQKGTMGLDSNPVFEKEGAQGALPRLKEPVELEGPSARLVDLCLSPTFHRRLRSRRIQNPIPKIAKITRSATPKPKPYSTTSGSWIRLQSCLRKGRRTRGTATIERTRRLRSRRIQNPIPKIAKITRSATPKPVPDLEHVKTR
jgi:hypothetical protein